MSHQICSDAVATFDASGVTGYVLFHDCYWLNGVEVQFNLKKLRPSSTQACHIHEYGDLREGCKSTGAHWNPSGQDHGSIYIDILQSHAGDLLNNITANKKGEFKYSYFDPRLTLKGKNSIIGRAVVIHDGIDDLGQAGTKESRTTGSAGGRMACAVIGISPS